MAAPREGHDAESRGVTAWKCAPFGELTVRELYAILRARAEVFVVEQECAFQDLDGADEHAWHLMGRSSSFPRRRESSEQALDPRLHGDDNLVAYCRLVAPGIKFAEASIGRVITVGTARGTGLGRELMRQALKQAERLWPGKPVRIGAQARLEKFYRDFGFVTASAPYMEDGIPHLEMLRPASTIPDKAGQTVGQ
jgi:ElaA protein